MTLSGPDEALRFLATTGRGPDRDIDLALTALVMAQLHHPGIAVERYVHHCRKTAEDIAARHGLLLQAGAKDDAATRLAAMKHIIIDGQEMQAVPPPVETTDLADLIRAIDTRRGTAVTLGILFIDAARRLGWEIGALSLPGPFVLRLDLSGDRLIFDQTEGCRPLQAADLRALLKKHAGPQAELSASYYEAMSNRQILILLQNALKFRQIQMEDYAGALKTVEAMRLVDPMEIRLLLDAGVLYSRTGEPHKAERVLEEYMEKVPSERARQDALLLLRHVRAAIAPLPNGGKDIP